MYRVQERFEKIANTKPFLSTYMVFAEAIRNTGLSEDSVRRHFYRLVDRDDYAKSEAKAVLRHLVQLANRAS